LCFEHGSDCPEIFRKSTMITNPVTTNLRWAISAISADPNARTRNLDKQREHLFTFARQITKSRLAMSFVQRAMSSLRKSATEFAGRMSEIEQQLSETHLMKAIAVKFKT
jgi:hypothetical protein